MLTGSALEGVFKEHDAIKRQVSTLRELIRRFKASSSSRSGHKDLEGESDDDKDALSITTVTPHELERVEEEDEKWSLAEEEENNNDRNRRRLELGRPRMPEPSSLRMTKSREEVTKDHHLSPPLQVDGKVNSVLRPARMRPLIIIKILSPTYRRAD